MTSDHWKFLLEFSEMHNAIIPNTFSIHLKDNNKDIIVGRISYMAELFNSMGNVLLNNGKRLADWNSKTKL